MPGQQKPFWERVTIGAPDECWPWQPQSRFTSGHGAAWFNGRLTRAHRVAWTLTHGEEPTLYVRHTCDNPPCCNPAHLIVGTQAENVQDMVDRGRSHKGYKLTEDQAREIKRRATDGERGVDLAKEFGVDQSLICSIKNGRSWMWL